MEIGVAVGRVLRQIRQDAGLTQEQLALEADVQRNYVSLIERGINQPTIAVLFKHCQCVEVQPVLADPPGGGRAGVIGCCTLVVANALSGTPPLSGKDHPKGVLCVPRTCQFSVGISPVSTQRLCYRLL